MKKRYTDEELEKHRQNTLIKRQELFKNCNSILGEDGKPFFNEEYLKKMLKINTKGNEDNEEL